MKTSVYAFCALVFLSSTVAISQTNRVLVSVNWPDKSYQNKVEVYDPANNLLVSICNTAECYVNSGDGANNKFIATYDQGCLALA